MAELEQLLRSVGAELDWPATPEPQFQLAPAPRRRVAARPVWAAVALAAIAIAVAFSVPSARSAILRAFHLGGVTVVQVQTTPRATAVPLGRYVGPVVGAKKARHMLGAPLRIPRTLRPGELHLSGSVVSTLLHTPQPVLLSELPSDGFILKKIAATSTPLDAVSVDGWPGFWLAGAKHVIVFPDVPPRLAGNVLVWQRRTITYRLEAPHLTQAQARAIAAKLDGTS